MLEIHDYARREDIGYTTARLRAKQKKIRVMPGWVERTRRVRTSYVIDPNDIMPGVRSDCHQAEVLRHFCEIGAGYGHKLKGDRFLCTKCGEQCKAVNVK